MTEQVDNIVQKGLLHWANATPHAPALIESDRRTSYAQLAQGAQRAAAWLKAQGVRQGDRVACVYQESPAQTLAQVELTYGLAWLGAVLLLVPPGAARAAQAEFLGRLGIGWVIACVADEPALAHVAAPRALLVTGYQAWDASVRSGALTPAPPLPPVAQGPALDFAFELTSGTTGMPKVVLHTHRRHELWWQASQSVWRYLPGDVVLGPMRWPGKVGWRSLMRCHRWGVAHLEATAPHTWDGLLQLQARHGMTAMNPSIGQLRAILASGGPGACLARPLRGMYCGGAHVAPADVAAARRAICPDFKVVYASTETGIVAYLPENVPAGGPLHLVQGMVLRVLDANGRALPHGQPGRLQMQSPWVETGYVNHPEATLQAFSADGFLSSDLGCMDADGHLVLLQRTDDVINHGGIKVSPQEAESALMSSPWVADAAVIACPHAQEGEVAVAFVVAKGVPDGQALYRYLAHHLDAWSIPPVMVGCASIARTPDGKVDKAALRALYAASVTAKRLS